MSGIDNKPVLSLCIPTWNRNSILRQSLSILQEQLKDIDSSDLEIFVSDNASTDNTEQVIKDFIATGMPINYNRNSENIGFDGNFIKCIQFSTGRYIWLLGDDDFLEDGALRYIVNILKRGNFGLIHIKNHSDKDDCQIITSKKLFLKKITYASTFISLNIFNSNIKDDIKNPEHYFDTYFLQLPFYLRAGLTYDKNVVIVRKLLLTGIDVANNGGYNFFEVFVESYLNIWYSFVEQGMMTIKSYKWEKRNIWLKYSSRYTYILLIKRKYMSYIKERNYTHKGLRIDNGWKIINKFYGNTLYFYVSFFKFIYWFLKDCCKVIVRFAGIR